MTWRAPPLTIPAGLITDTRWSNPVQGRLTSNFGLRLHPLLGVLAMHTGLDIAAACGTPVHAASGGVVMWVGSNFQGRTGNQVVIDHGNGILTRYGHLLSGTTRVKLGDVVQAGQQIAVVGGDRTIDPLGAGNSTGCHLHFEVNLDGGSRAVNPADFLRLLGVSLGVDAPLPALEATTVLGAALGRAGTGGGRLGTGAEPDAAAVAAARSLRLDLTSYPGAAGLDVDTDLPVDISGTITVGKAAQLP